MMRPLHARSAFLGIVLGLLVFAPVAHGKQKKKKPEVKDPQDAIEVVGHIPSLNGTVTRFMTTQHYSSYYLYVERDGGKSLTLIDVSNAARPMVLADLPFSTNGGSSSIFALTGTAALITDQTPTASAASPAPMQQTIRIMDFSDAQHPKTVRTFDGVTTMSRDDRRGLIFVANGEGIWILHQNFATDPEVEKAYEHYIQYNR